MKLVIDSSVFVSALRPLEKHSNVSRDFFAYLTKQEASGTLPLIVPLEVANVFAANGELLQKFGTTAHFFRYFADYELLPIDEEFSQKVLPFFADLKLKTTDALIAASAALQNATLISWDTRLVESTRKIAPAYTPSEIIKGQLS